MVEEDVSDMAARIENYLKSNYPEKAAVITVLYGESVSAGLVKKRYVFIPYG